jgi:iron(III) transport system ATP-binding protein
MAAVNLRKVVKHYDDTVAVRGIDLDIADKEFVVLVGPSGCGKSTTLRLIAGLETVQSGRISLNGRLLAEPGHGLPPEQRRVGLMFQDFALFPHLRVAENVGFGLTGLDRRGRAERIEQLLAKVEMGRHARSYPHTLSGGEQQRVALARALAPAPQLMLLDEAFSALDTELRSQVREETMAVLREAGTPTLLVTHDAEEAIRVGDRIHAMQHGRIVPSSMPGPSMRWWPASSGR